MRIVLILALALNGLATPVFAQSANTTPLAELQSQVRDDIARICLPIQYRDGSVAYRNCVKEQISQREETSRADKLMDTFSSLSFDDRYAIQQACGSAEPENARDCTANQIVELLALPEPNLGSIANDEQYVMQQTCFHAQSKQGAASYRQCQLNEIASVKHIAAPDYTGLNTIERNALQLKCSANQSQLLNYRNCLIEGTANSGTTTITSVAAVAKITQPTINSIDTPTVALVPTPVTVRVNTNTPQIRPQLIQPKVESSEPELASAVAALPIQETAVSDEQSNQPRAQSVTNAESEVTAEINGAVNNTDRVNDIGENFETEATASNPLQNFKDMVIDAFTGLSTQGKMLLGAIVVMPLALLALLSGSRRRDIDYEDDSEYNRKELKSRVRASTAPSYQDDISFEDDEDIAINWDSQADSLFDDTPTIQPETAPNIGSSPTVASEIDYSQVDEYAPTKLVSPIPAPAAAQQATVEKATQNLTTNRTYSEFSNWLNGLPREEQTSLAIEFLLYWIAFGDERYEPSLKQQIFQNQNPSNNDIVKRWVLKEDVHAFADTIEWLQGKTTDIQKVQILRLLMAMLINGQEPTPVQNTLFRFLSDAFHLDSSALDEMFEEDFNATLPSMPRVDRMAWWDRQSAGTISLWNARKLNNSDELTRLAAQLGVDGEARSEHVEAAYERAANRCRAERYDHLGNNEHRMIRIRLDRLQQARDGLLEALA